MTAYFIRRFLLIIPTFIGITLAVFVVMQFVPGGPVERQIMRYQMAAMTQGGSGGVSASGRGSNALPEEQIVWILQIVGFGAEDNRAMGCSVGVNFCALGDEERGRIEPRAGLAADDGAGFNIEHAAGQHVNKPVQDIRVGAVPIDRSA